MPKNKAAPTTMLTWVGPVGCYYRDQDGAFWSTTWQQGGFVCDDCGKIVTRGYSGAGRTVCGCLVKVKYPRRRKEESDHD